MKWTVIPIPADPDGYLEEVCKYYNLNRFWISNNYDSQLILQDTKNRRHFYFSWYEEYNIAIDSQNNYDRYNIINLFNATSLTEFKNKHPYIYMIRDNPNSHVCALFANKDQQEVRDLIAIANKNLKTLNQ